MRAALNNMQSTAAGFAIINDTNVFKVCDKPHPETIKKLLFHCAKGDVAAAEKNLSAIWRSGYSSLDILGVMFRVCKFITIIQEKQRLFWIQEIGNAHMRVADGLDTLLQLQGLIARLCAVSGKFSAASKA